MNGMVTACAESLGGVRNMDAEEVFCSVRSAEAKPPLEAFMTKKQSRMLIDAVLTVLIILSMQYQLTGATMHELFGALFFAAMLIHLALSFKWMKGSVALAGAKKLQGRRKLLLVIAVLLAVDMVALVASSIVISRVLASVGLASELVNSTWSAIHTASAYGLCVLTVVHLATHWELLLRWVSVPYDPERRAAIGAGVGVLTAVGAVALGVNCQKALSDAGVFGAIEQGFAGERTEDEPFSVNDRKGTPPDFRGKNDRSNGESQGEGSSSSKPSNPGSSSDSSSGSGSNSSSNSSSDSGSRSNSNSNSRSNSNSNSSSSSGSNSSSNSGSNSSSNSDSGSSSSDGICYLCRKQCSLSAPQCDRPYREGLL